MGIGTVQKYSSECDLCGRDDQPLIRVYGTAYCKECDDFERAFDIDAYEQEKRERIAESQEY